ncbi:FAR1-related sequence 5-like protein [Tanacetum coccineum]|uniref:FAR1-related sequence 5-like protein n=1 Tax=Tanacetum coccineum TaxID=301880 RepID=A0ABQ5E0J3_9ASTR
MFDTSSISLSGLRLNQSPNSVNIPNISRSSIPVDTSSSNISVTNSISEHSSNPIDVSSATVNDRPRIWIPAVESILKPSKGHVFVSLNQAYDFYKHYGKLGGLDIKLGKGIIVANSVCSVANGKGKGKVTGDGFSRKGKTIDVYNVSNPEDGFSGKSKNVDVSDVSKPNVKRLFRKNTSCKTGCFARMVVRKINGGMFEVYGFVEEHNHPLVSHDDIQFTISSRELGFPKQQFMLQVANSNVGPGRAFKLMKEMYGGFENVGATATDCKIFRRDLNLFIRDRDAQMVVEKYRMVFVPFTEIDNHNRFVTFGAGLLSDETVNSYKWLLQSFKKALVADPQVVVTDQDLSMKQAVEVGSSVCKKSNFKEWFCRIVWNERISIDMFEQEWASIIDEFDLGSHMWLCDLYDMRHRWILAFLCDEGMSGLMWTTSRSESENRYFNIFTNPNLTLVEFIGHFESLEKDAAELFTLNIFYEIQDEIVASIAKCLAVNVEQVGLFEKYFIRETEVKIGKIPLNLKCMSSAAGIRAIRRIFEDTVDRLVPFKDNLDLYRLELSDLLAKALRINKKDTFCTMLGVTEHECVVIKVPRHSKNKGTGAHTRWENMDELIQNEAESSKKRRTCFACGKAEGHNSRTDPYKDAINATNKRTKRSTHSSDVNYKE